MNMTVPNCKWKGRILGSWEKCVHGANVIALASCQLQDKNFNIDDDLHCKYHKG